MITVDGKDRDAFRTTVNNFNGSDRLLAGTNQDEWKFTVGVLPEPTNLRIIPGQQAPNDHRIFGAFGLPVYAVSAENARPIIENIKGQIGSANETLKSWLG